MPHTKEAVRRKRRTKAVPVLGAAGLSLSLAVGMSAASGSIDPDPATSAPAAQQVMDDEQISDVSLATFHVFDNDGVGPEWSGTRRIMVSQGACGADLYLPQNPPAVSRPVYQPPVRSIRPAYKHKRS